MPPAVRDRTEHTESELILARRRRERVWVNAWCIFVGFTIGKALLVVGIASSISGKANTANSMAGFAENLLRLKPVLLTLAPWLLVVVTFPVCYRAISPYFPVRRYMLPENIERQREIARRWNMRLIGAGVALWALLAFLTGAYATFIAFLLVIVGAIATVIGLYHRKGEAPHCRACWYAVDLDTQDRCPECGGDLTELWGVALGARASRMWIAPGLAAAIAGELILILSVLFW